MACRVPGGPGSPWAHRSAQRSSRSVAALVDEVERTFGVPDLVVYNASGRAPSHHHNVLSALLDVEMVEHVDIDDSGKAGGKTQGMRARRQRLDCNPIAIRHGKR